MACELIILDAVGQGQPGTTLMSLKVTGSASGCSAVSVTILCTGQHPVQHIAVPVVADQWETTFSEQELKLAGCRECGSFSYPLEVKAHCDDGVAECSDSKPWPAIPCASGGDCCPTVSIQVTEGACDAQGRRNVTFVVTTAPATGLDCPEFVFAQMDFGDGMLGAGFVVPPNTVWQETHPYVPGSYTAKVRIIAPPGCPDIPVKVGPLVECPPGCPEPGDVTVAVDGCDAEGRRIVSVNVLLPGSGSTTVSVDWQDGTTPDSNLPIQGGVLWTGWHRYLPPGPYKVKVSVAGCPPITKPVGPLPPCNGGNGNGHHPCPWWNPACWKFCGWLGALLAILIGAFIVGIATGVATDISAYLVALGIEITADVLVGVIGGVIAAAMAAYLSLCGACNLAKAMIAGGVLGIVAIIALAVFGVPIPNWLGAVITALFIIAAGWLLYDRECG